MEIIEREDLEDKYMPDAIDEQVIKQVNDKLVESIKKASDCTIDVAKMNYRQVENLASIISDVGYYYRILSSDNSYASIVIRTVYSRTNELG